MALGLGGAMATSWKVKVCERFGELKGRLMLSTASNVTGANSTRRRDVWCLTRHRIEVVEALANRSRPN